MATNSVKKKKKAEHCDLDLFVICTFTQRQKK